MSETATAIDGRLLKGAVKALGPMALLTAWLYYVGWVRTNSQARYFGVDPSLLGYSTTDYILRSVTSLFGPAGALLVIATLTAVARHRLDEDLSAHPQRWPRYRWLGRTMVLAGALSAVLGAMALALLNGSILWSALSALCLLLGGLLLLAGRYLSSATTAAEDSEATGHHIDASEALLIGLVLIVGLFAAGFFYAIQVGTLNAYGLERQLTEMPEIHVLSANDLHLGGDTECEPIRSANSAYNCRYTGLRLLVSSNDRLFLVPEGWSQSTNRYVHVVPVTEGIRVDLRTVAPR